MDVFKNIIDNGFERLAENIIRFMDTDKAMEYMIESDELSEDERKIFKKTLKKSMLKEAQEICEKKVGIEDSARSTLLKMFPWWKNSSEFTLLELFPWWKNHLEKLENRDTLETFNELYDILVLLQELPKCMKVTDMTLTRHSRVLSDISVGTFDDMIDLLKVIVKIFDEDVDDHCLDCPDCPDYSDIWTDVDSSDTDDSLSDLSDLSYLSDHSFRSWMSYDSTEWYQMDYDDPGYTDAFWEHYAMKD